MSQELITNDECRGGKQHHHHCATHHHCSKRRRRNVNNNAKAELFLVRNNLDMFLLGVFMATYHLYCHNNNNNNNSYSRATTCAAQQYIADDDVIGDDTILTEKVSYMGGNDQSAIYALLFPWLVQTCSIFIYYLITRHFKILPYTAIVFIYGMILGFFTESLPTTTNPIAYSSKVWLGIDGYVVLLIFLPGLIYNDAHTINVHLFFQAFWQLIIYAFPMVVGGTFLTALVAEYIIQYEGWSWTLCVVFGAILSGTDPIAVAGLLKSAGAPDRLNMHISGESLLNDGSVVVLFNVFSRLYYHEQGFPPSSGEKDYTYLEGFEYFFRLVLGGTAIGIAFGLLTVLMLYLLNRRLSERENLVQVVLLISAAYLGYFVADVLAGCSGIMCTITAGVVVKVLGEPFINDRDLTLHFWQVTAELLNTLLFALGGCLWGNIMSDPEQIDLMRRAEDWGYFFLLYFLLTVIRFVLVFGLYPITSRIGLGTNVKESIFMSYGGFRGTVGIALALSINITVKKYSRGNAEMILVVDQFFVVVGAISLITLLFNGMTSGPLLSALGLAAKEKTRKKVVDQYIRQMIQSCLQEYVRLLSQHRFRGIDHSIIKEHVPFLHDISFDDLMVAVERHKNNTPVHLYVKPRLEHVFPYLKGEQIKKRVRQLSSRSVRGADKLFKSQSYERLVARERTNSTPAVRRADDRRLWNDFFSAPEEQDCENEDCTDEDMSEVRLTYIEILKSAYYNQFKSGSLEDYGDLPYSLLQGLKFCEEHCSEPLNDWAGTKVASQTRVVLANSIFPVLLLRLKQLFRRERRFGSGLELLSPARFQMRFLIRLNLAFVNAHRHARKEFASNFASSPLKPAEARILQESEAQLRLAEEDLKNIDRVDVITVKGHLLCLILLNKAIQFVEQLCKQNLIPEAAASELLEKLDLYVENVSLCDKMELEHKDRLNQSTKIIRLRQLPQNINTEFNILAAIEEMTKSNLYPPGRRSSTGSSTNNTLTPLALNRIVSGVPEQQDILSPFSPIEFEDSEDALIRNKNLSTIAGSLNIEDEIQVSTLSIPSGIEELDDTPNGNSRNGSEKKNIVSAIEEMTNFNFSAPPRASIDSSTSNIPLAFSPIKSEDSEDEIIAGSCSTEDEIPLGSLSLPSGIKDSGDTPNDKSPDGNRGDRSCFLLSALEDDERPVGF